MKKIEGQSLAYSFAVRMLGAFSSKWYQRDSCYANIRVWTSRNISTCSIVSACRSWSRGMTGKLSAAYKITRRFPCRQSTACVSKSALMLHDAHRYNTSTSWQHLPRSGGASNASVPLQLIWRISHYKIHQEFARGKASQCRRLSCKRRWKRMERDPNWPWKRTERMAIQNSFEAPKFLQNLWMLGNVCSTFGLGTSLGLHLQHMQVKLVK